MSLSLDPSAVVNRPVERWLGLACAAAAAGPIIIWFLLYPVAGYNPWTLRIALGLTLLTAAAFIFGLRLGWQRLGISSVHFVKAVVLIGLAYALILLIGTGMNAFMGANLRLFRDAYSLNSLFENWLLTGFGEELLFCGVLFTLTAMKLPQGKRWLAVLLVALLFALWHLPGYLAQGRPFGQVMGRMALNAASWGFFGTIYAISGNLWLAAFTHASTDYGLSPLVTDEPLMGLIFMAFLVLAAWLTQQEGFHIWVWKISRRKSDVVMF
jgi:membrane protease YdiL (CAAX protease family)